MPVPERETVDGELGAVLVMVTLPVTAPATAGANVAVNVELCPAGIVAGSVRPETPKPAPAGVNAETVTLADPPLVSVTIWVPVAPTATVPNATGEGLAVNWPWTPVPESVTVAGEFGALLTTEMLPEAAPPVVGAKRAENVEDWPAGRVRGKVSPVMLKPVPVAVAAETTTLAEPPFVNVTV